MKPNLQLSNRVHVVYDGNSIMHGINAMITAAAPIAGSGCTTAAVPVPGQTWSDMYLTATDVDAALTAAGEFCILLLWEHTNTLNSGATLVESWEKMLRYIDGRRAVRPDVRIGIAESLPREGLNPAYHTLDQYNVKLQTLDEWCWARAGQYDWEFISTRVPGSPYRFTNFSTASFDATQPYWNEPAGTRTHPTTLGYQTLVPEFSRALHRMRAR